ncbi:MAG: hypothetical protein FWD01_00465 [Defluviitaleaceae bacterium]|nr:hypothetical protein [Defluviitaleaceae bacterium]
MKKIFLLLALLAISATAFAGCDEYDNFDGRIDMIYETENIIAETDNVLTGGWEWLQDSSYNYIFNDDGTGIREVPFPRGGAQTFTWFASDGILHINLDFVLLGAVQNEQWTYIIDGDLMIMESLDVEGIIFQYSKREVGIDDALIGYWLTVGGSWRGTDSDEEYLIFNADGTGIRMNVDSDYPREFTWIASGDILSINFNTEIPGHVENERWIYEFDNNYLTMQNQQFDGFWKTLSLTSRTGLE